MTEQKQQQVLDAMRHIIDPDLGKDIVSLGFIKDLAISDEGDVSFTLELTTPACPVKEQFREACTTAVSAIDWVRDVTVIMSAQAPKKNNPLAAKAPGLAKVANILAVSSCKGGVGKSTVAVNLAYTLHRKGAKVGLFDADVYGPSLPTMVQPESIEVYQNDADMIVPIAWEGVKLMSFGFITEASGGGPAIMRGPMVTQIINQLLTTTDWGELDYLVLDLPPGTGDVQLTLTQLVPITAAVIVTTPQQLSFVDVVKGIQMFDKVKVPVISVIENMSYFACPSCGTRHDIFGKGARDRIVRQFGIANAHELPVRPEISDFSDRGRPVVLDKPEGDVAGVFSDIADAAVMEVSKIRHGGLARPEVRFDPGRGIVVTKANGEEKVIPPARLRRACRCANCVDEFTREPILQPEDVPENVYPENMQPMGNYAMAVTWSDGHTSSIYPYEQLLEM